MDLNLIQHIYVIIHAIIKLNIGGGGWLCSYWKHASSIIYATATGWRCSKQYVCHLFIVCVHTRTNGIIHKASPQIYKINI